MRQRVWIISEFYFPEENATGYLLTRIAEGLANEFTVNVVCGLPSQPHQRGVGKREIRNGVHIHRCASTTLNKDVLPFRLVNLLTICMSIFMSLIWKLKREEKILVVTNPPLLPFVVALASKLKGAYCSVLTYDVYPEALIAAGIAKPKSLLSYFVTWLNRILYRSTEHIVVLGRDMRSLVVKKLLNEDQKVVLIPNWADLETIIPSSRKENSLLKELRIADKFVVQYNGNMGRTHGIEHLFECMKQLLPESEIHFLFIGTGAKKQWLESTVKQTGLANVTILPYRLRKEHSTVHNACDLAIISMLSGMSGVSVPSRLYNIMAAGKPVVVVAENSSELAHVVREECIGWVISPDDTQQLVATVLEAAKNPNLLREMGTRARVAAEKKYSFQRSLSLYKGLFRS